jgi:hypothetical protein
MGFFATHIVSVEHVNGQVVATNLPVQLDPVNLPIELQVQGLIPTDIYDCETIGWMSPVPIRTDYLVDQNGVKYQMFSTVFVGINSLQFRVTKYLGATP